MRNNETGRSMVEMLGVLAVIGVLSVGGIAGYMIAMNRHHSNNVLEGVSSRAVIISAQKLMGQPADHPADMAEEIDDYAVAVVDEPGVCAECFGIEVSGIPQGVCRYVLNQKWATPEGVYLNDDEYPTEDGTNCDEEDNVIEFVFSPSMGGESSACGYCQHDEDGTCVADDTCDNGCPGNKPMKGDNGTCYSCVRGSPQASSEECTHCPNRFRAASGNCTLCTSATALAADVSECSRCPNRSMVDGKCTLTSCLNENEFMSGSYGCKSCSVTQAYTPSASECAKCSNRTMENGKCILTECPDDAPLRVHTGGETGYCVACSYSFPGSWTAAEDCDRCAGRFLNLSQRCITCTVYAAQSASAAECAKCPEREMYNGKCVLKECPSDKTKQDDGSCV